MTRNQNLWGGVTPRSKFRSPNNKNRLLVIFSLFSSFLPPFSSVFQIWRPFPQVKLREFTVFQKTYLERKLDFSIAIAVNAMQRKSEKFRNSQKMGGGRKFSHFPTPSVRSRCLENWKPFGERTKFCADHHTWWRRRWRSAVKINVNWRIIHNRQIWGGGQLLGDSKFGPPPLKIDFLSFLPPPSPNPKKIDFWSFLPIFPRFLSFLTPSFLTSVFNWEAGIHPSYMIYDTYDSNLSYRTFL